MKFLALLVAAVVAQDPPAKTCTEAGAALSGYCDSTKDKCGCLDPNRCSVKPVPNICVSKDACDVETSGVKAECGATTLAASLVAAVAMAATL